MKVSYDKKRDIAYIQFSRKKPDGAIEIAEGVVLDTTAKNEIVGIEIFDASKRLPVKSLFTLEPVEPSMSLAPRRT
jgi:uncharacterized protein YuzE